MKTTKAPTRLHQKFYIARTDQSKICTKGLTPEEKAVISELRWFSLDALKSCPDVIYPPQLATHIETLLTNGPPEHALEIELQG